MLELDEGQLSRPVLRGRGGSNTSLLPGLSVSGSSQRARVCAGPDPAGTGVVEREAWGVEREAWSVSESKGAIHVSRVPESGWPIPLSAIANAFMPSRRDHLPETLARVRRFCRKLSMSGQCGWSLIIRCEKQARAPPKRRAARGVSILHAETNPLGLTVVRESQAITTGESLTIGSAARFIPY